MKKSLSRLIALSLESFRKRLKLAFIHDIDTEYLYDIQKNKDKIRLKLSGFTFQFIKYRLRTCLQLVGRSFASCPTSMHSFASCPTSECSFLCLMSYIRWQTSFASCPTSDAASFASRSASVSIFFPNIYTQCYI